MMHEVPLRACRREFVGQAGAAHTELPQGRRPGHRPGTGGLHGDQVAPHAQPGALPTAELLQGWIEAQDFPEATHRPGDNTRLTATPPRPLPPSPASAQSGHSPPGTGAGPGSAGGGGTRAARARAHTWPKAMAGTAGRLSCQGSRLTPQPGNGAAWSAVRGRAPPGTAGDRRHTVHVACLLLGQEGAEPAVSPSVPAHTTGSRRRPARHRALSPRNRRPVLRLSPHHWVAPERRGAIAPCPSPGGRRKPPKTRPSRCSSLVRLRLERSDGSGVLRAPSAIQSSTWTPFLALNSVFIDSSARCLG